MANLSNYESWAGANVYDSADSKLGSIDQIYLDDKSGQPEWLTVSTGWFGTSTQFVPITGSARHDDGLKVPYTTDLIKDAPSVDTDGHLDATQERKLYDHYGLPYDSPDHETTYGGRGRAVEGFEYADTRTSEDVNVTVTEQTHVSDTVRKERVDVEGRVDKNT